MEHDDRTADLARRVGLPVTDFVRVFGSGWSALPHGEDPFAEPSEWYVAGEPAQLMLDVGPSGPRVARPRGVWSGPAAFAFEPVDVQPLDLPVDDAVHRLVVRSLLQRRRTTFRYCPRCLRITPPEAWSSGMCTGCEERWLGVVH